jgi:hemerythrin-like domain-containing protein
VDTEPGSDCFDTVSSRRPIASDHLLPHIEHEDNLLFRIADELFDEQDTRSLSQGFEHAAATLGADRLEFYEEMSSELEKTWGI